MNIHRITDTHGDLIDIVTFCSDSCHRDYCKVEKVAYEGWDGCHDTEGKDYCRTCGVNI